MKKKIINFNYSWVIVGISFLMVCVVLGFCSSSKSLYISAITEALGISRSAFSINDSCRFIATAVVNLFFGFLVGRFGAKKLIAAGFACLVTSSLIYSFADNIFVFYIGGIFLGIGLSWTTTTMVGYVVNKWCSKNKGTIMGAILAANGVGAAVAIQIVSPIIYEEGNLFGYRNAYRLVALILLIVGIIVVALFKEKPWIHVSEETNPKKKEKANSWVGIEYSAAIKKAFFFGAAACIFLTGMVLQGISGIAAPHLSDVGLDAAFVASVLSVSSISLTCFKFLTGVIYDKFGLRITSNICMITAVVVIFLLALVTDSEIGKTFAMIYGIFSALALPLETIMLPIYAGDLFGQKSFDKILGIFASVNTAGYALGAPVANLCYDITGTYNIALYISCGLMFLVMLAMQFVISAAKREKKLVSEQ